MASDVFVFSTELTTEPLIFSDPNDRTSATDTCFRVDVNKRTPYGAGLGLSLQGGGSVTLRGVRATWTRSAADIAPRSVGRSPSQRP